MKKPKMRRSYYKRRKVVERETGLEPATACLEGRNSTTELLPLIEFLACFLNSPRSGCADSNCGPPAPKAGALPTAPHPALLLSSPATLASLAESVCTIARLWPPVKYFSSLHPTQGPFLPFLRR